MSKQPRTLERLGDLDNLGNDIEETTAGGIMDMGDEEVDMGHKEDQNPAFVQYQEENNER